MNLQNNLKMLLKCYIFTAQRPYTLNSDQLYDDNRNLLNAGLVFPSPEAFKNIIFWQFSTANSNMYII